MWVTQQNTNQSPLSNRSSGEGKGKRVVLVGCKVRVQPARLVCGTESYLGFFLFSYLVLYFPPLPLVILVLMELWKALWNKNDPLAPVIIIIIVINIYIYFLWATLASFLSTRETVHLSFRCLTVSLKQHCSKFVGFVKTSRENGWWLSWVGLLVVVDL